MNKPVSLYIHIPFCKSKCPYCDFYSARPEEDDVFDRYLAALCARLAVYGEKYGERLLHTVYFGGGTPSVFGAKRLCRVLEKVKEQFNVAENAEITTECNPADVDVCISETLTPMMLQFLQCKTFGNQRLPDGWMVVAAGNPPEYNKSVREFDVVTLDRVKRIDVEEDFAVWKEYAYRRGIHGAILSYLEIRRDHFAMRLKQTDYLHEAAKEEMTRLNDLHIY